jgi:type VI protein secretion system component VasF
VRVSRFEIPGWAIALLAVVLAGVAQFVFRLVLNRKINRASQ